MYNVLSFTQADVSCRSQFRSQLPILFLIISDYFNFLNKNLCDNECCESL